jgi:uroporphyrinogen decarboxylase
MPVDHFKALLAGQKIGRALVWLWGGSSGFAARNVGYPLYATETDPEKCFYAQLWTAQMYGSDNIPVASFGGACRDTWVFGGEIKMPSSEYEQAPSVVRYPVASEEDAGRLRLPADIQNAGPVVLDMQFARLEEKHGLPITVFCSSPIEVVRGLCSVDNLCRWMIKKPALVHRLMQLSVDYALSVVRYWAATFDPGRIVVFTAVPTTSNQVISPKMFETFVLPYQKDLHEKILLTGIRHIYCHVCGEQNRNLTYWAQIPMGSPGILSFGREVDLTTAIEIFGQRNIIAGNIDPATIQNGTPQQVYDLCRQALEKAQKAPCGFILMPGCGLPPAAPPYNVYMLKKALDDFDT